MITDLESSDLIVDEIYGGSRNGNASDDPLPKLVGVDNQAGFRHLGQRPKTETLTVAFALVLSLLKLTVPGLDPAEVHNPVPTPGVFP